MQWRLRVEAIELCSRPAKKKPGFSTKWSFRQTSSQTSASIGIFQPRSRDGQKKLQVQGPRLPGDAGQWDVGEARIAE